MGRSKSTEKEHIISGPPKRTFTIEFFVGLFTLMTLACVGYLAVGLGGLEFSTSQYYRIFAEFDNVSGLKEGASVEIAGVKIGGVVKIALEEVKEGLIPAFAIVTLRIDKAVQILDDDIASIRTKGIIGDRYVKISRGGSDIILEPGDMISETESVVDIEDIIGKIVHSLGSDDDETEGETK